MSTNESPDSTSRRVSSSSVRRRGPARPRRRTTSGATSSSPSDGADQERTRTPPRPSTRAEKVVTDASSSPESPGGAADGTPTSASTESKASSGRRSNRQSSTGSKKLSTNRSSRNSTGSSSDRPSSGTSSSRRSGASSSSRKGEGSSSRKTSTTPPPGSKQSRTSSSALSNSSDHAPQPRRRITTPLPPPTISGATLILEDLKGRDLVAKDRNLLGMRTSSDPYIQVYLFDCGWHCRGQTAIINKTLSPVWNEAVKVTLGADAARALFKSGEQIELRLYDHDPMSDDDYMGSITLPLFNTNTSSNAANNPNASTTPTATWYRVQKRSPNDSSLLCLNATGDLQARLTVQVEPMLDLRPGEVFSLPSANNRVSVGMAWGNPPDIEVETYCVAMDEQSNILLDECLYYDHWNNANQSLVHGRNDTLYGKTRALNYYHFDDQVMHLQLDQIPSNVKALFFVMTIQGPAEKRIKDLRRVQIRFLASDTQKALCRYVPAVLGADHTSLLFCRLARDTASSWCFAPIGIGCPGVRDWGSMVPHIKAFMGDLVPKIVIDPRGHRMAVPRPERSFSLLDYVRNPDELPECFLSRVTLYRHGKIMMPPAAMTVVMLDKDLRKTDHVNKEQPEARDQSTFYDCEKEEQDGSNTTTVEVELHRVSQRTKYVCFVATAEIKLPEKTDQHQKGADKIEVDQSPIQALWSLEEEGGESPQEEAVVVAQYSVSYSPVKSPGILLAVLYRDDVDDQQWNLRVVAEPAPANHSVVDYTTAFMGYLRSNAAPSPMRLPDELELQVPSNTKHLADLIPAQANPALIPAEQLPKYL